MRFWEERSTSSLGANRRRKGEPEVRMDVGSLGDAGWEPERRRGRSTSTRMVIWTRWRQLSRTEGCLISFELMTSRVRFTPRYAVANVAPQWKRRVSLTRYRRENARVLD
jgi:hypothetical protein